MRSRFILLVVAILLVAGFAALNWSEVTRPAPLLFGPVVMDAPLGAILLGLLALATLIFAVTTGTIRTQALMESRQHYKSLEAQRALADKAEASRFTDLRQHLDTQLRELRDRDGVQTTESHRAMLEGQRELRAQLEQINRTMAARLSEIEHRLDARLDRLHVPGNAAAVAPVQAAPVQADPLHRDPLLHRDPVVHSSDMHAAASRDPAVPEVRHEPTLGSHPVAAERIHQQRVNEQRERAAASDKPQSEGWRRWF